LLFNIAKLLSNPTSRARFAFDLYIKQSWDIEHIHSASTALVACVASSEGSSSGTR
jgi:hypothetical protein